MPNGFKKLNVKTNKFIRIFDEINFRTIIPESDFDESAVSEKYEGVQNLKTDN